MTRLSHPSISLSAVALLAILIPGAAPAQDAEIVATLGEDGDFTTVPGGQVEIPVIVDLSNAGSVDVAGVEGTVTWNADAAGFVSASAGDVGTVTVNTDAAGSGEIRGSFSSSDGATETFTLATLTMRGPDPANTTGIPFALRVTLAEDAGGSSLLGSVRTRGADLCASAGGVVGDANGDGTVNIIDAQQIARFAVGLSVSAEEAVRQFGDVNGDGTINILDAQQVARFAVGLSTDSDVGQQLEGTECNFVPLPSILAPAEGTTVTEGTSVTLEGQAVDDEDGAVPGGSLAWSSDLDGDLGTGETVTTSSLSAGDHLVTLTATDSEGASNSAQIALTVGSGGNSPPEASIDAPADGTTVQEGESVTFEGTGTDDEDGELSGDALVWSSDLDGELGAGGSLTVSDLSAGTHTVTLTVTDSQDESATDQITINVGAPPSVTLSSPSDESIFAEGDAVSLEGSATDPNDGELTGDALVWSSSEDGELGAGESLTVSTLSAGPHTITLTATDSDGNGASASVRILVESPGFDVRVEFLSSLSSDQRQTVRDAPAPWARIITGDLSPFFVTSDLSDACLVEERGVDDLVVAVRVQDIDGQGMTLAQARPCLARLDGSGNFTTPISGIVTIDEADLGDEDLEEVVTHEVGHVLGIGIGPLVGWGSHTNGLTTRDPFFTGPATVAAFEGNGGEAHLSEGVPLANMGGQGTAGAHWRELNFENELMTGYINRNVALPISRVSVGSLTDIGFEVDPSAADPFALPMPQVAVWTTEADATLSRPASSGENFGGSGTSDLDKALVAGSNNAGRWSDDPADEVFSALLRVAPPSGGVPSGVSVESAELVLTVRARNEETLGHDVEVVPVTSSWSEGTVTWDGRPSFGSSPVLSFDYRACDVCTLGSDALRDLAVSWLDGSTANDGLLLRAPDAETDPTFSVGFFSREIALSFPPIRPWIQVSARTGSSLTAEVVGEPEPGEAVPLGDDIREGILYGISPDGRIVRQVRMR